MSERAARSLRGLLIDLDGTLYHGERMIEGADELIGLLRRLGASHLFVTNNSSASPETVAARLSGMGIPASPRDVCTSAQAAAAYVAARQPGAPVHVVGEPGLRQAIAEAGLIETDDRPAFVVQGIDRGLAYDKLALAVRFIREGAEYVLTNPDLLLPSDRGLIPGAGSIAAMLQAASGAAPVVIGKPSPILMDFALRRLGEAAADTLVVGDNLATDIAAGMRAGCETALVMTGLTNDGNFERLREAAGCEPDHLFADLHRLASYISERFGKREK